MNVIWKQVDSVFYLIRWYKIQFELNSILFGLYSLFSCEKCFIFIKVNLFKLFSPKQSRFLCLFHLCLSIFRKSQLLKGLNHYGSVRKKKHCIRSAITWECSFFLKNKSISFYLNKSPRVLGQWKTILKKGFLH